MLTFNSCAFMDFYNAIGIRVYKGRILSLDKHLERLLNSAKAFCFKNIHSKEEIVEAIFRTLAVNGMRDGVHMRLTLTRGEKCTTSSMNPDFNVYGTTLVILAEWKPPELEEVRNITRSADFY
jgi:branched-subunit amino acid aminotransferase/4-amino-4-deoxychorismate lyase